MAIDIKVSGGVDFNAYLAAFAATFEAGGRGAFSQGLRGDEYALWEGEGSAPPIADGQAFVVDSGDAGDLAYDFMTHSVGGTIDSIDFGTGVTDLGGGDYETASDVLLSGLDLTSVGADGIVNRLILDLMDGGVDVLLDILKEQDLNFMGSGKADAFSGFKGDDVVNGGAGKDDLAGGKGADELLGGKGSDRLSGGAGADRLDGGAGSDRLTGGAGDDAFVFGANAGKDVITDFDAGPGKGDVIAFAAGQFDSFEDVLAAASSNADGDVVITIDASTTITLAGVAIDNLHANDFLFA